MYAEQCTSSIKSLKIVLKCNIRSPPPPPPTPQFQPCVWVGGLHNKPCVSVSVSVSLSLSAHVQPRSSPFQQQNTFKERRRWRWEVADSCRNSYRKRPSQQTSALSRGTDMFCNGNGIYCAVCFHVA